MAALVRRNDDDHRPAPKATTRPRESDRPQPLKEESTIKSASAWELLHENQRRSGTFPMLVRSLDEQDEATTTAGHEQPHPPQDDFAAWLRLPPGLHEIAGEAGAGKSQIALSLSVDVAAAAAAEGTDLSNHQHQRHPPAPPFAAAAPVYYICMRSSSKFVERLHQMVEARGACPSALHRIRIREALNVEHLVELLHGLLCTQFATSTTTTASSSSLAPPPPLPPPRLVVLDSVADLVRGESAPSPGRGWTTYANLRNIARMARAVSEKHGVAVLCVNQVTTNVATGSLKPALGLTWAQEMDRSYVVSRTSSSSVTAADGADTCGPTEAPLRSIELRRSSQYGPHRALFTVQARGVSIVTDSSSS